MKPINVTINEKKNGFHMPSEYTRARLAEWMTKYKWFSIQPIVNESKKQRAFYHGAVCPLYAFYHETLDHHNHDDLARVHEWLKIEYNGEYFIVNGKSHLIGKTTKQKLNDGFLERCIEGLVEHYGINEDVLNPERYKNWRDTIFPHGGPKNYVDYLVDIKLLKLYN